MTTLVPEQFRDVVTFTPVPVKIIRDRKTVSLFSDRKYWTILVVLRQRLMTVRDLQKAYREAAEKDEDIKPKSNKTIYRYLQVLKNAGLIVPAGQRLVIGKPVTEKLFSRAADFFLLLENPSEYWKTRESKQIARRIGNLLSHWFKGKTPPLHAIQELLTFFDRMREEELERLIASGESRTLKMISTGSISALRKIIQYVGIFAALLKKPELLQALQKLVK